MRKYTNVLAMITLLAAVSIVFSGCSSNNKADATDAQLPSVKAIKIGAATVTGATGKIVADQTLQVVSKVSGRVAAIHVDEGSKVKKGDLLVQLESEDFVQQLNQAKAGLSSAQAKLADVEAGARTQDLEAAQGAVDQAKAASNQGKAGLEQATAAFDLAQKTFNQTKNNYDTGDASKDDVDKGTLDFQKAKSGYDSAVAQGQLASAQLAVAQSRLDLLRAGSTENTVEALRAEVSRNQAAVGLAQNTLDSAAITSPIDGIVVKRNIGQGEMAFTNSTSGTSLVTLVSMDQVKVEVSVSEDQINQIQLGSTAAIKVASLPGKSFQGIVNFVSPVSDPNNNTFPVKLTVKNTDDLLRAGAIAEVAFSDKQQTRIELPKSALIKQDNKTFVDKVESGAVHQIAVETEEKNQDWVYLKGTAPLQTNDQIVINPSDKLTDGTKVRVE
jgi:HlyD family secretion protein